MIHKLLLAASAFSAVSYVVPPQQGGMNTSLESESQKHDQQQQNQQGSTQMGNAAQAVQTLQNQGFAPLSKDEVGLCQEQMLNVLLRFAPNDSAKNKCRNFWQEAINTGIQDQHGGYGGIRFLSEQIFAGIEHGQWPWTQVGTQSGFGTQSTNQQGAQSQKA
jgi:hypothetical protein